MAKALKAGVQHDEVDENFKEGCYYRYSGTEWFNSNYQSLKASGPNMIVISKQCYYVQIVGLMLPNLKH